MLDDGIKSLDLSADPHAVAKRPVRYQDASVRDDLDLPDIPETWAWTNLRFLLSPAEAFCYGVVQPGANEPDGARLIRAGDLAAGRVNTSSLRRIPMAIHADYRRSQLLGGEILVTVAGAGIGETAIAQPECAGFNIARAVAKLPVREFNARYAHLWLQNGRAIDWMKSDSREVARPTLNLEQLQTLPLPVAPLPEQQEIARRLEGLFALADQLEERLAKAHGQVDQLTPPSSPARGLTRLPLARAAPFSFAKFVSHVPNMLGSPPISSPKTPPTNQQRNCWNGSEASGGIRHESPNVI